MGKARLTHNCQVTTSSVTVQPPFVVGMIQDHADADAAANLARAERLIRDAAARGAQIICLKELFNAPVLLQVAAARPLRPGRADSRADHRARCRRWRRSWRSSSIVPIFERQAAGVYRNSAAVIDADGALLGVVPQDAHPGRSAVLREVLLHAGRRGGRGGAGRQGESARLQGLEDALRDHRRADLLGPVVSRGGAHHRLLGAQVLFYPTAIGWHPARRPSGARRRSTPGGRCSARTPSPTASTSRRPTASATRTSRAPTASRSSATRSSAIRSGAIVAEAGEDEADPDRALRSRR